MNTQSAALHTLLSSTIATAEKALQSYNKRIDRAKFTFMNKYSLKEDSQGRFHATHDIETDAGVYLAGQYVPSDFQDDVITSSLNAKAFIKVAADSPILATIKAYKNLFNIISAKNYNGIVYLNFTTTQGIFKRVFASLSFEKKLVNVSLDSDFYAANKIHCGKVFIKKVYYNKIMSYLGYENAQSNEYIQYIDQDIESDGLKGKALNDRYAKNNIEWCFFYPQAL